MNAKQWEQRIAALEAIWQSDACGRRRLARSQRAALCAMLRSAREAHAQACRQ